MNLEKYEFMSSDCYTRVVKNYKIFLVKDINQLCLTNANFIIGNGNNKLELSKQTFNLVRIIVEKDGFKMVFEFKNEQ